MRYCFMVEGYEVDVSDHGYFYVLASIPPHPYLANGEDVIYNGWVDELDPKLTYDPELDGTYFGALGNICRKDGQDALKVSLKRWLGMHAKEIAELDRLAQSRWHLLMNVKGASPRHGRTPPRLM